MSTTNDNPPAASPARAPAIEIIARGLWIHGGSVLLCRNIEAGYLYFPGGHVEFGESGAVALAREMLEEAGVRVRVGQCVLVGECSFVQKGRRRHEVNLMFHVEHGDDAAGQEGRSATPPPQVPSLEPHIAFEWVALDQCSSTDIRPTWLARWVVDHADRMVTGALRETTSPAWVSVMAE